MLYKYVAEVGYIVGGFIGKFHVFFRVVVVVLAMTLDSVLVLAPDAVNAGAA